MRALHAFVAVLVLISLVTATYPATACAEKCTWGQLKSPPAPPPASPILSEEIVRLRAELGHEPIVAFDARTMPPAGGIEWSLTAGRQSGLEPMEPKVTLEDGSVLYVRDAKPGQRYVTRDGDIIHFLEEYERDEDGKPAPTGRTSTSYVVHYPLVSGLFINKADYRLAVVATPTPAAFDSLASARGVGGIFGEWRREVTARSWELSMRDYPENDVGKFEWFFRREMVLEGQTLTFIAWRNDRPVGARPEDDDSEILPAPVGQVVLKEDGLVVLKGGLR